MGNGYTVPSSDETYLRGLVSSLQTRLRELEALDGGQLFQLYANESYGSLLSVTTSSTLIGVEALIGTPLTVERSGRYLITCAASVETRLRGTGGAISVDIDVKDQNSPGGSIGISSPFLFGHTANDDVQLSVPVVTSGITGFDASASLVCRVVYTITPGSTDGRLEIPSVRLTAQQLKAGAI